MSLSFNTKAFVVAVMFLLALLEVGIIMNLRGVFRREENDDDAFKTSHPYWNIPSSLTGSSSAETLHLSESQQQPSHSSRKDGLNSLIQLRSEQQQPYSNKKLTECPLDEPLKVAFNHKFPESYFTNHFSQESQWKDSRSARVFSRLRIPQEMSIFREFILSREDMDYYRTVSEPAKLSAWTEEIFCREPTRPYLKELTDKCRVGAKRSFKEGGYCTKRRLLNFILWLLFGCNINDVMKIILFQT